MGATSLGPYGFSKENASKRWIAAKSEMLLVTTAAPMHQAVKAMSTSPQSEASGTERF